tara:strand:- start:129 stop:494 length:366 start_codon:yes stop_codon:yes gene_type:complete
MSTNPKTEQTSIVCVKKAILNKRGIQNFEEWNSKPNTLYIGRNMNFYIKGTYKSKWFNPFSVKKYGREQCLELYEKHLRNTPELYDCLEELKGKELGCWCKPNSCHGDIMIKLLHEKSEEK